MKHIILTLIMVALVVSYGMTQGVEEPENLLQNGGFEDGIFAPWNTYGASTVTVVDAKSKPMKDAGIEPIEGEFCIYVEVPAAGANFWDDGIQHKGHVFQAGKSYTLAAFLYSEDNAEINFKPELAQDPWTGYGSQRFIMTPEWKDYHISTGVIPAKVDPAEITFHIAFAQASFFMDYVRFYEGDYVEPEIGTGLQQAVSSRDKLATTWAKMK